MNNIVHWILPTPKIWKSYNFVLEVGKNTRINSSDGVIFEDHVLKTRLTESSNTVRPIYVRHKMQELAGLYMSGITCKN
jgi:hypothetical protein